MTRSTRGGEVAARMYVGGVEVDFYGASAALIAGVVQEAQRGLVSQEIPSASLPTPQPQEVDKVDEGPLPDSLISGLYRPDVDVATQEKSSAGPAVETNGDKESALDISQDSELIALGIERREALERLQELRQKQAASALSEVEVDDSPTVIAPVGYAAQEQGNTVVSGKERRKPGRKVIKIALVGAAMTLIVATPAVGPQHLGKYVDDACSKKVDSFGCLAGHSVIDGAKAGVEAGIDFGKELLGK